MNKQTGKEWLSPSGVLSSFAGFRLSKGLGDNITVSWLYVDVVVLYGICDLKPKLLVELDRIFVVCLNVQVYFRYVLLGAYVKNMIQ